jgi:hypothetical protein
VLSALQGSGTLAVKFDAGRKYSPARSGRSAAGYLTSTITAFVTAARPFGAARAVEVVTRESIHRLSSMRVALESRR